MEGMLGAIKSRRGGLMDEGAEDVQAPQPKGDGLKGLVQALSDDQKAALLQMLVKDQSANENPQALEEGAMGPGESMELEEFVSENEQGSDSGHESEDEIAESMVSSSDKYRADQGAAPRNLGDRVRMNLAKQKKKG